MVVFGIQDYNDKFLSYMYSAFNSNFIYVVVYEGHL